MVATVSTRLMLAATELVLDAVLLDQLLALPALARVEGDAERRS